MLDSTLNSSLKKEYSITSWKKRPQRCKNGDTAHHPATAGQKAANVMQPKGQARQSWDDFTVILHSFTPFHHCKMLYCGQVSKIKV